MSSTLERLEVQGGETTSPTPPEHPTPNASLSRRLLWHIETNRTDFILVGILVLLTALTRIWNLGNYPRWFSDEGVYVQQAWAVQNLGQLAPYTYWYDHPPLGWIQMAGWAMLAGSWHRNSDSLVMVGREYMVVMAICTSVLLYVFARRLQFRRAFAFAAGLLWVVSPLAITFSRYTLLDNMVVAWSLAALVLLLTPKRRLLAVLGGCACLAMAVLTKETALLVAPAALYLVWSHFRGWDNRKYAVPLFLLGTGLLAGVYPLYALIKNELTPGDGHVSLWQGQVLFQLSSRAGSGSVLDSNSPARLLVDFAWLGLDSWLPIAGVVAMVPALFIRRLRAPAFALAVPVGMMLRGGYLPYPFIIGMLPFMALLVSGVAEVFWPSLARLKQPSRPRAAMSVALAALLIPALVMTPIVTSDQASWKDKAAMAFTAHDTSDQQQVLDWATQNLSKNARLVTEGELWLDLRLRGFDSPQVIWTYKVDSDPAVKASILSPDNLDYLVIYQGTREDSSANYPTLSAAANNSRLLKSFGPPGEWQILVLQVIHPTPQL